MGFTFSFVQSNVLTLKFLLTGQSHLDLRLPHVIGNLKVCLVQEKK